MRSNVRQEKRQVVDFCFYAANIFASCLSQQSLLPFSSDIFLSRHSYCWRSVFYLFYFLLFIISLTLKCSCFPERQLAAAVAMNGDLARAEVLHREALAIMEKTVGEQPHTASRIYTSDQLKQMPVSFIRFTSDKNFNIANEPWRVILKLCDRS